MGNVTNRVQQLFPAGAEQSQLDPSLTRLDLHKRELKQVPNAVLSLSELSWLCLDENEINKLPANIGNLQQLQHLRAINNELIHIPPQISQLSKLEVLDLSNNKLISVVSEIGGLGALKDLALQWNKLESLPAEIGNLTNLKSFTLYINQLTDLPLSFASLTLLKQLDIAHNRFTSIPTCVRSLPITYLNLAGNNVQELPDWIGELTTLSRLDLRLNQLTALPPALEQLSQLKCLYLNDNQLCHLKGLKMLPSLQELTLNRNQLLTTPGFVFRSKQLRILQLAENELTELSSDISKLTNLTELDLSSNKLESLPTLSSLAGLRNLFLMRNSLVSIPDLPDAKLAQLNCYGNGIQDLSEEFVQHASLSRVVLAHNRLTALPSSIWHMPNLTHLDISGNQVRELPEAMCDLTHLLDLNVSFNLLTTLPDGFGSLAATLHKLNLGYNSFHGFSFPEYRCPRLVDLILSGNSLEELPHFILASEKLRTLDLSANHLSALPDEFSQCTNLQALLLTLNKFSAFPESICSCKLLKDLDFSHNCISLIPTSFEQLSSLVDIDFSDNLLTSLPISMKNFSCLVSLKLSDNDLVSLPKDIPASVWVNSNTSNQNSSLRARSKFDKFIQLSQRISPTTSPRGTAVVERRKDRASSCESLSPFSIPRIQYGCAELRGRRSEQQDTAICIPNYRGSRSEYYFGLFDGHGGAIAAQLAASNLHNVLAYRFVKSRNVSKCLIDAFRVTHQELAARNCEDGAAAIVVYISGRQLYVANAGDCRAVLCKTDGVEVLTNDHRPYVELEKSRVREAGGFVSETGRVNGVLAVTRSLGDVDLHPAVDHTPDIFELEITRECTKLVIACDGLWDMMTSEEVASYVSELNDPVQAAVALRDKAFCLGSTDNVSVIVVNFAMADAPRKCKSTSGISANTADGGNSDAGAESDDGAEG